MGSLQACLGHSQLPEKALQGMPCKVRRHRHPKAGGGKSSGLAPQPATGQIPSLCHYFRVYVAADAIQHQNWLQIFMSNKSFMHFGQNQQHFRNIVPAGLSAPKVDCVRLFQIWTCKRPCWEHSLIAKEYLRQLWLHVGEVGDASDVGDSSSPVLLFDPAPRHSSCRP